MRLLLFDLVGWPLTPAASLLHYDHGAVIFRRVLLVYLLAGLLEELNHIFLLAATFIAARAGNCHLANVLLRELDALWLGLAELDREEEVSLCDLALSVVVGLLGTRTAESDLILVDAPAAFLVNQSNFGLHHHLIVLEFDCFHLWLVVYPFSGAMWIRIQVILLR